VSQELRVEVAYEGKRNDGIRRDWNRALRVMVDGERLCEWVVCGCFGDGKHGVRGKLWFGVKSISVQEIIDV
jgi:hypothetical protein